MALSLAQRLARSKRARKVSARPRAHPPLTRTADARSLRLRALRRERHRRLPCDRHRWGQRQAGNGLVEWLPERVARGGHAVRVGVGHVDRPRHEALLLQRLDACQTRVDASRLNTQHNHMQGVGGSRASVNLCRAWHIFGGCPCRCSRPPLRSHRLRLPPLLFHSCPN